MNIQTALLDPPAPVAPTRAEVGTVFRRPTTLARKTLIEVLIANGVTGPRLAHINDMAIRDGINLAVRLGHADADTLRWVERALERDTPAGYPPQRVRSTAHLAPKVIGMVLEHRRMICSTQAPPDAWATADRDLWAGVGALVRQHAELKAAR